MSKQSVSLKVHKTQGENAIVLINKLKIADRNLEIQRDKEFIYIPLLSQPSKTVLKTLKREIANLEVTSYTFPKRAGEAKTLMEVLDGKLPPHLLAVLPRSADIVGDIAIVEIPPELEPHKTIVGEAILKTHKNVRTVLAKAGAVSGIFRLRDFTVITGERKTITIHKEHGCRYYVDVAKAYFSPRLSHEHKRVASLVKECETVVDMFAGVGPFSVLIAKIHENVKVYAVDVNPDAIEFLRRNARLNRVDSTVYPILGDARQIAEKRLQGVANRVIMNLPEKAMEFVDAGCQVLKPEGGIMHLYGFIKASGSVDSLKQQFAEAVEKQGRKISGIPSSRLVRETAPFEWQVVLDAVIR
ncbi:MAG TPA: class I SAM-dependent methyltransferase family protein [Candidatus Acidoferrum sp.]|jgi:tRNA (guanine37-N1)-methyltransferase|nr:class I SAM-dependent methyltransferase family protein [Candidatus Acidoferrum sp.]